MPSIKLKLKPALIYKEDMGYPKVIITLLVGVIYIVVAYFAFQMMTASDSQVEINGTITSYIPHVASAETTYTPVVSYTYDGQSYEQRSSYREESQSRIGETQRLAINPDNPEEVEFLTNDRYDFVLYLAYAMGGYFLALSVYSFVRLRFT